MRLDDFHRAVESTVASKRLGSPVFVRYLVQAPVAAKGVSGFLGQIAGAVGVWLGQELERIYALGSVKGRHVTLTLDYRGGASAQITWSGTAWRGPGVDLMLVGNRGALYHDFGAANLFDGSLALPAEPAPKTLTAWIDRALRSGQPEAAEK